MVAPFAFWVALYVPLAVSVKLVAVRVSIAVEIVIVDHQDRRALGLRLRQSDVRRTLDRKQHGIAGEVALLRK